MKASLLIGTEATSFLLKEKKQKFKTKKSFPAQALASAPVFRRPTALHQFFYLNFIEVLFNYT